MQDINLEGAIPAAILPMVSDFEPDFQAFERYLEWLISQGAIAIAVNMDTGEGPQLSLDERIRTARHAVSVVEGRIPVLAGVSGGTTSDAVKIADAYRAAGVDGLVIFPNPAFLNEPLDPRIPLGYHHAIAEETDLPLVLFQLAPVFAGVLYSRQVLHALLEIPQVVAIKEASFDAQVFNRTKRILAEVDRPITFLTGNDRFITESLLLGAKGALLGFCAVGCRLVAEQINHLLSGDFQACVAMGDRVQAFADFIYQDPVLDYRARCKAALALLGVLEPDCTFVRPPLLPVPREQYGHIRDALFRAEMLKPEGG